MKHLFKYVWWVIVTIIIIIDLLLFVLTNLFILIWYFNFNHQMTWRRYKRRKVSKNCYCTQKSILDTYKMLLLFDDSDEVFCNENGD